MLILTYDGRVDLLLHRSGEDLRTGQLELAVKAVVPGVRIGWGQNYLRFILPGSQPTRSELLLVDEPILSTREGPAGTGDQAFFTRTFASIWLEAIDATNPFHTYARLPSPFLPPPFSTMPSCAYEPCGKHAPVHSPHRAHFLVFCSRPCRQAHLREARLPDPDDRPDRCCTVS